MAKSILDTNAERRAGIAALKNPRRGSASRILRVALLLAPLSALALAASCGSGSHPSIDQAAKPAGPSYPPAVDEVAKKLLGTESEVVLYGDLANNGKQEALIVNRVKKPPDNIVPGTLVTRAAIIEDEGGNSWKEVFLCDQHLKNPNGFLGGIPLAEINGWRIQTEHDPAKGLTLYFTPLAKPTGGYIQTIGVRWNPEVKRYQSLDRNFEHFLTEVPSLEPLNGMP
ncbi:MAG TPA: hypothetical protein VJN21_05965 [Candidatus Acidoferrales bacterium]|nr:hypothetical protein [Candidatus Acidoferrales bacterium]